LTYFKQERRVQNVFSEDSDRDQAFNTDDRLGLVATDDYFGDRDA
jgi:hypothetical protein